jgi:hypothetical protein
MKKNNNDTESKNTNKDLDFPKKITIPIIGSIRPGSKVRIKVLDYKTRKFYIDNTGSTPLYFYVSDELLEIIPETALLLLAGEKITMPFERDGQPGETYLVCFNSDLSENGQYFVNELIND